jgi:hypothetical protein
LQERLNLVESLTSEIKPSAHPKSRGLFLRPAMSVVFPKRDIPLLRDPALEKSQLLALERSREKLDELARRLAAFIAERFEVEGLRVRP